MVMNVNAQKFNPVTNVEPVIINYNGRLWHQRILNLGSN